MNHSVLVIILAACSPAWAQTVRPALQPAQYALAPAQHGTVRVVPALLAGDYAGSLGPLNIVLHIAEDANGKLSGAIDSPGRGAMGIRCARFHVEGRALSFTIPALGVRWVGVIADDGSLDGSWSQGRAEALNFARLTVAAERRPRP